MNMEPGRPAAQGACDHFQPGDLAQLAEAFLSDKKIPASAWEGCRFGYGAGGGSGPFKSVYMEVERRGSNWVAVKLDRLKEALPAGEEGFRVVRLSDPATALIADQAESGS